MEAENYLQRRERLYAPIRQEGIFTWDWCYGREYALAEPAPISLPLRMEISEASEALANLFTRVVSVVQQGGDVLLEELGLPEASWEAVRLNSLSSSVTLMGRFDFAYTPQGLKMLEFNSDTPTGIVEAFYVNDQICQAYQLPNPNEGMNRHIADAFQGHVAALREQGKATDEIVFSSLDWHEEDRGTTSYVMQESGLAARYVPLDALRLHNHQLQAPSLEGMRVVDIWYRLHALEVLAEEQDEDGYPTGGHILQQIGQGRPSLINPPAAFISQTKALQALIWNLYEEETFFTQAERKIIHQYFLPTYLENPFLGVCDFVVKPFFGREGGAVLLCDKGGAVQYQDRENNYWNQPMIWQERVAMETTTANTARGSFFGHRLWGSFVVGGRASAILARLDGPITGNLAYFQPTYLKI